jgi:hypothetical protein
MTRKILFALAVIALCGGAFAQLGVGVNFTNIAATAFGEYGNPKAIMLSGSYKIGAVNGRLSMGYGMSSLMEKTIHGSTTSETDKSISIIPVQLTLMPTIEISDKFSLYPGAGFDLMMGTYSSKSISGSTTVEAPDVSFHELGMHFLVGAEAKVTGKISVYVDFSHIANFGNLSTYEKDSDDEYYTADVFSYTFYRVGVNYYFGK